MGLAIIAAVSNNNVIGRNNSLPWEMPSDLKHFKKTTSGHILICGRKTYESIGKPLPNRTMIVISKNPHFQANGCEVEDSVEKALWQHRKPKIFCIGGAQIYKNCMEFASELIITKVNANIDGDTFFPEIDIKLWDLIEEGPETQNTGDQYSFQILKYKRNKSHY